MTTMCTERVVVVVPSLVGGGAERVAIDLANHWSEQGRAVTLIAIDQLPATPFPLHRAVRCVGLGLRSDSRTACQALLNNCRRVWRLRKEFLATGAQTVVSFTDVTNVTSLLAIRGTGAEVIVCERTDPRQHRIGRVWSWLRQKTYCRSRAIVVQTESVRGWAESCGWKRPIVVIPNAAPILRVAADDVPREGHTIAALGRLSPEKGFDLLIDAFARIAADFPEWRLHIHGEGADRARLERLIGERRLADRVTLPGWAEDSERALRRAELFVLPSRYEGFPNALLEAMAVGLPCVSFDCDCGPREILREGVDGLLVPPESVPALAEALARLMRDPALRQQHGTAATEVHRRFSRAEYYRCWDALLCLARP